MGWYVVLVGALLLGTACDDKGDEDAADEGDGNGDGDGDADGGVTGDGDGPLQEGAWTVFVYGHGDHNLSFSLVQDIVEMAKANLAEDVRVVVLADFDASQDFDQTSKYPSGAQWLMVPGGGVEPTVVVEEGELNLDDPAVLRAAIANVFTNVPARRRAVILWDHGGSWSGGFGGDSQDGTEAAPTPMAASTVAKAIGEGLKDAKVDDEVPLDILSFDTCLMAGAEVAWEFRSLTQTYIANAELDYGNGWDYTGFLSYLSSHQDESADKLAAQEVALWDAHHESAGANDTLLRSHVAISMPKLVQFGASYKTFVSAWLDSTELSGVELGRASYFALPPYMNDIANPTETPELRDVGVFLSTMTKVSDEAVASAALKARTALEGAILARSQGDIREVAGQFGMHISLPVAASMTQQGLAQYADVTAAWNDASGWAGVLGMYASLNDGVAPTITASITNAENPTKASLPTVTFGSADLDVAQAEVNLGYVNPEDNDAVLLFGLIGRGAIDAAAEYDFAWNGQLITLPDGMGGAQPIFVRIWEDVGLASAQGASPVLATFGAVSTPGSPEMLGALLFQDTDAETGVLTLLDPPVTLSLAEVAQNFPGTTFTPIIVSVSVSTSLETVTGGIPIALDKASLPLSVQPAAAGSYVIMTSVDDVFGNIGFDAQLTNVLTTIQP